MALTIQLSGGDAAQAKVDVLAVGVTDDPLDKQKAFASLDETLGGQLATLAARADFRGRSDTVLDVATLGRLPADRVVLVGLGARKAYDDAAARSFAATAARCAASGKARSLALALPEKPSSGGLRVVGEGVGLGAYRFTKYFTGERAPTVELEKVTVFKSGRVTPAETKAVRLGLAVSAAIAVARDAVNEPGNELTPEAMAALARAISRKGKLKCKVLDKQGIADAGMKLHYAVGQGSANEPRFIHMTYKPKRARAILAFVGKGLTFDSGGLCIKPAPGMGEMKSDMGGAAAVLGLMAALADVRPNVEVHGIIGAAENMPDAAAYRPGDVFGSLDGKTVEIINTDAEGRLVLADALAYARKLEPAAIIDAATLTGACVVALGKTCSAFYATDESLAKQFDVAAKDAGEAFWRMPLLDDLREQLKSDIADLKHTGDRWGGSITAALFLREFVGTVPWVHCDIAGPALADRARGIYPKGGTAHAALTFLRFVEQAGTDRGERRRGERRKA